MTRRQIRYKQADGYNTRDLLDYGVDHLRAAGLLFKTSFQFFDSGAHLAHLGLELLLKALVLEAIGSFPNEHDLTKLYFEIRQHTQSFVLSQKDLKILSHVTNFVQARYPKPNPRDALGSSDWLKIENLANSIVKKLPPRLRNELDSRDVFSKGGRILMSRPKTSEEIRRGT